MKVLVVGGGGREHALVWKIKQSPRVKKIFCAPGNAGIAELAECPDIKDTDINGLVAFSLQKKIDLAVIGPEAPLAAGAVDTFKEKGIPAFGPTAGAAAIEGSKVLAKELMVRYNIPTADYAVFDNSEKAISHIKKVPLPCVVKADGLAAGKGVIVAFTREEAVRAVENIMVKRAYGQAGERVVIEDFLSGEELSVLAFTDGETVVPMLPSQDHKQVFDDDSGPNTGGMGAYTPAPVCTKELSETVLETILKPVVRGLLNEGRHYQGVLYAGLMLTKSGPRVLEFNARFGDPETQPLLTLLETDIIDVIESIMEKRLDKCIPRWKEGASVCVVASSGGYPGAYETGKPIMGLDRVPEDVIVFHAGTARSGGRLITSGGRVLGVTAYGSSIGEAIKKAYSGINEIYFEGMHFRTDIGAKAAKHLGEGAIN